MKFSIIHRDIREVTSTYMRCIEEACRLTGADVEIINNREKCDRESYVITDHLFSATYYILKGYKNHISWFQGIIPEESFMYHNERIRFWVLNKMEELVLRKCKYVILVSEEMRRHYEKKYNINLSKKSYIMPCYNETSIVDSAFDKKDKYKNNTFVFAGGIFKWQGFEYMAKAYSLIEKKSQLPTHFYIYTKDQEEAKNILEKHGVRNYSIDYVDFKELSDKIQNYKYGFVLREKCVVNNVATPTKFSNYLANGIIPIYSSCLDSFNNLNKELDIGIVCETENIEAGVDNIINQMENEIDSKEFKNKCKKAFDDYYNFGQHARNMAELFSKLESKK